MAQSDTLTDGQFFDPLRMGNHARGGAGLIEDLIFVQDMFALSFR